MLLKISMTADLLSSGSTDELPLPSGTCFSSGKNVNGHSSYWSYEVCPSLRVRQWHSESSSVLIEHSLGVYSPAEANDEWQPGKQTYSQIFIDGTGGRKTEVNYYCATSFPLKDGISAVREPTPLSYQIDVRLRMLCPDRGRTAGQPWLLDGLTAGTIHLTLVLAVTLGYLIRKFLCPLVKMTLALNPAREPAGLQAVDGLPTDLPDDLCAPSTPTPEPTPDLERTAECVICLEQMERSAVGSCPHHFCAECLLECCRLTPRCPRCQTTVRAVHLDAEFDALLKLARAAGGQEPPNPQASSDRPSTDGPALDEAQQSQPPQQPPQQPSPLSSLRSDVSRSRYVVRLMLPRGARAGITLRTCRWRFGVAVSATVDEKMAYRCGLRVGDVIVSMNGVPCTSHEQCIETINRVSAPRAWVDAEILCLVIPNAADVRPLGARCLVRDDDGEERGALDGGEHADECAIQ